MPKYTKAVKKICVQETLLFEGPLCGAPYPYRKARKPSGIACWRVRMTINQSTPTQSSKMEAILQLIDNKDMQLSFMASFFSMRHPCYGQLTPVKTKYPVIISRAQV